MSQVNTIQEIIIHPITKQLFLGLVSSGIFFYIMQLVHNYINTLIALKTITGSFRISKNDRLRFTTSTGFKDGCLIDIDRKRVEIEFPETIMSIPTIKFVNMSWDVVKS